MHLTTTTLRVSQAPAALFTSMAAARIAKAYGWADPVLPGSFG